MPNIYVFLKFLKSEILKNQSKAYSYAVISILSWSTVAIAFKIALRSLTSIQLLAIASYVTILILITHISISRKWGEVAALKRKFFLQSAVFGLLNPFGYYLVLFKAYSLLPAQIAQPLNYTWPLVLVLFSIVFLKQRVSSKAIMGLIISFIGVLLISFQGKWSFGEIEHPFGVLFCMGSALIWASYWLLNASRKENAEISLLFNFIFAGIYITILLVLTGGFGSVSWQGMAAAIYTGFFEMGLTYIFWLKALKLSSDTSKVSHLVYFSPFISLFFIHLVLHENIYITTFAGLVLIISGVLLSQIKKNNQDA